jgi:hypothetical protein
VSNGLRLTLWQNTKLHIKNNCALSSSEDSIRLCLLLTITNIGRKYIINYSLLSPLIGLLCSNILVLSTLTGLPSHCMVAFPEAVRHLTFSQPAIPSGLKQTHELMSGFPCGVHMCDFHCASNKFIAKLTSRCFSGHTRHPLYSCKRGCRHDRQWSSCVAFKASIHWCTHSCWNSDTSNQVRPVPTGQMGRAPSTFYAPAYDN